MSDFKLIRKDNKIWTSGAYGGITIYCLNEDLNESWLTKQLIYENCSKEPNYVKYLIENNSQYYLTKTLNEVFEYNFSLDKSIPVSEPVDGLFVSHDFDYGLYEKINKALLDVEAADKQFVVATVNLHPKIVIDYLQLGAMTGRFLVMKNGLLTCFRDAMHGQYFSFNTLSNVNFHGFLKDWILLNKYSDYTSICT